MTVEWGVGALAVALAVFVMGLAGFGIGIVSLAVLPFLVPPRTAVVLVTLYPVVAAATLAVQLRRHVRPATLAGLLAGLLGGAVGTPGPPVILWAAAQPWKPRAMKANLQAFFVVNQAVILAGFWWAGLLTREVWGLAAAWALPGLAGFGLGLALFARVDHVLFRRIVFLVIFAAGALLLARG